MWRCQSLIPEPCVLKVLAVFIMALFPLWHLIDWYNGFYRLFINLLQQWINTTSLHAWLNRVPGFCSRAHWSVFVFVFVFVSLMSQCSTLNTHELSRVYFFARLFSWLNVLVNYWGRYETTKLIRHIMIIPQSSHLALDSRCVVCHLVLSVISFDKMDVQALRMPFSIFVSLCVSMRVWTEKLQALYLISPFILSLRECPPLFTKQCTVVHIQ